MPPLKIKYLREKSNLSVEFVSIQMELSVKEYNNIEKGKIDIKISKLDKLAKIFKVKKSDFLALEY